MTSQLFKFAVIAVIAFPISSSSQDSDAWHEKYRTTGVTGSRLFFAAYSKFGNRIRATAILRACEKTGIATSIELTGSESSKYLLEELIRMKSSDRDVRELLNSPTSTPALDLVAGVSRQLAMFEFGYSEAIKVVKDATPEICAAGMASADKILKERK